MWNQTEEVVRVSISGGTPGADSNDYILFSSVVAFGAAGLLPISGLKRFSFGGYNDQAGTLKAYRSTNLAVTWDLYYSNAIVAASSGALTGPIDFDVSPYQDWKLVWTNGGVAQGIWRMDLVGYTSRQPST